MKNLLSVLLVVSCLNCWGQGGFWEKVSGPPGGAGRIYQPANGKLYLADARQIYRSDDSSKTWIEINLPNETFGSSDDWFRVGRSGTLYVRKKESGLLNYSIYISQNHGETWELSPVFSSLFNSVDDVVDGLNGILVGLKNGSQSQLVRSSNGGQTWETIQTLDINFFPSLLEVNPDGQFILRGSNGGIYSVDNGTSWESFQGGGANGGIFLTPAGTILNWGGTEFDTLSGITWPDLSPFKADLPETINGSLSMTSFEDGTIWALSAGKLFESVDDGKTWSKSVVYDYPNGAFKAQRVQSDSSLFISIGGALWRSKNRGLQWTFAGYGTDGSISFVEQSVVSDTAFSITGSGLWRTVDNSQSWQLIQENVPWDSSEFYSFQLGKNGRIFFRLGSHIYRSDDAAETLIDISPPNFPGEYGSLVSTSQSDALFFSSIDGLYRTTDGGNSWQIKTDSQVIRLLARHPSGKLVAFFGKDSIVGTEHIYAGTFQFSEDEGLNWTIKSWKSSWYPAGLEFSPTGKLWAIEGNLIYQSSDFGETWTEMPISIIGQEFFINSIGHLFVANYQSGVMIKSVDEGLTWQTIPPIPTDETCFYSMAADGRFYGFGFYKGGLFRTTQSTTNGIYLTGLVRRDTDNDCATDDADEPLQNWMVKADGTDPFFVNTDSAGHYTMFAPPGDYSMSVRPPLGLLWQVCDSVKMVGSVVQLDTATADFPVKTLADCPFMSVDLGMPPLTRCFSETVGVHFCNLGTLDADSAAVILTLDSSLNLTAASRPFEVLGNGKWRFPLGFVAFGDCGDFWATIEVACDTAILGDVLCMNAVISPDSLCILPPGWSGANLVARAACQADSTVVLEIENTGPVPTTLSREFIVIEDDVVLMTGNQNYSAGEVAAWSLPANGHTRRIESEQEPNHPFGERISAALAGCGPGSPPVGDFVNLFSLGDGWPSHDEACRPVVGSYDPNEKVGYPQGVENEHFIRKNEDIEYVIRFQNTGTDTAFTVIIRDSLPVGELNPSSLRMGASSHPMTWKMEGNGYLEFKFAGINLPDSSTNEAASHGFVQFKISQQPGLALGSQIRNRAAIYFDFNPPIFTEKTLHTIGENFLVTARKNPPGSPPVGLKISPNPMGDEAFLELEGVENQSFILEIRAADGRLIRQETVSEKSFLVKRRGLVAGVYFLKMTAENGGEIGAGKLLVR